MATREIDDDELESMMVSRREKLRLDRAAKQQELDDIDKKLHHIDGYLNPGGAHTASKPRAALGPRAKPGTMPVLWKDILGVVEKFMPDGMKAADIYDELGAKSAAERRRIDVALPKLRESGQLDQPEGRRTPYILGSNYHRPATPAETTSSDDKLVTADETAA